MDQSNDLLLNAAAHVIAWCGIHQRGRPLSDIGFPGDPRARQLSPSRGVAFAMNVLQRLWAGMVAAVIGVGAALAGHIIALMTLGWEVQYLNRTVLALGSTGFLLGFAISPRWLALPTSPLTVPPARDLDSEPVVSESNPLFPNITPKELATKVRAIVEEPLIEFIPLNPKYGSWILGVRKGKLDMEYIWCGPRHGLGGTDHARPATPDDNPFAVADEGFQSVDEALDYLRKLNIKYASAAS